MAKENELKPDFDLKDLFKAYFDCRKHKRNTASAREFECYLEENLLDLYKELKSGKYKIGRCICFGILKPKPREVWAANFRDRIVHHLIYNAISERFYKRFIRDTYSCIPKRGSLAAGKRLLHFARSASKNYTEKTYYLKADLSNFFVSIDKSILYSLVCEHVKEEWLLALIKQVIFHNHQSNVYIKSPRSLMNKIPKHKSLFYADKNCGLPIGNLTSQFFSNLYLNKLDQYIKKDLKCKYYCRYVDDFIILDNSPQVLNEKLKKIKEFVKKELNIEVHPKKTHINKINVGMDFVGYNVKPNRILMRPRTLKRIHFAINNWNTSTEKYTPEALKKFCATLNSYLGMLVNLNCYKIRQHIIPKDTIFIQFDENFNKVSCPF